MKELRGKVAVVTGAASGIGRGLARRFATEGMNVVLADVEEKALDATARELEADGATVVAVPTDVSRGDEVDALAARTLDAFGAVHVVCNNAGVASGGNVWKLTEADWQWVLGVNLWGVIHGIRAFVPHLIAQGEGHVVNTASLAGHVVLPGAAPYNASKFAVVAISETLHQELSLLAPGVKVSVLCPGWVNTGIGESERNRPDDLRNPGDPDPTYEMLQGMIKQFIATGMDPAEVAGLVLDAIRDEHFYVFTHPGWTPMLRQRFDEILEARNPTMPPIPS